MTSRPLKILIANSGQRWIGEVGHCVLLQEALRRRGHQVWIACRRDRELERYAREHELPHFALGFSSRFSPTGDLADILKMRRFIRRKGIQVVHVHRGKDHWCAAFATILDPAALVRTRHVVMPVRPHFFNRWLYRRETDAVVSVSEAAESGFGPLLDLIPNRRVILSAVDSEKFSPAHRSADWRAAHGPSSGGEPPVWIGLIGRFHPIKGHDVFLEAARTVAEQRPHTRFLMAGTGDDATRLRYAEAARDPSWGGRLLVEGFLPDLPQVVASLDIGVVASLGSEGSSRATLEYMASGLPVVATAVGGIPEIMWPAGAPRAGDEIHICKAGLLVSPADAPAMARAITRLVDDAEERAEFGSDARAMALANHDTDQWAAAFEEIYYEALARKKPTRAEDH